MLVVKKRVKQGLLHIFISPCLQENTFYWKGYRDKMLHTFMVIKDFSGQTPILL